MKTLICKTCGISIINRGENGGRRTYCSEECSKEGHQRDQLGRRRECNLQARLGLRGGTIGAINEQVVAIDLIKRGYEVYHAFDPTHPFDLLAIRGDLTLKIEVKTETVLPSGLRFLNMKKGQIGKHDILARVANLSEITYVPPLP